MSRKKAIVIGAGVGGLSTANLLAKAGYEVLVLEKNAQLGGRMGELKKDGFMFDTGPSWYLMPEVFDQYFSLFGKKTQDYFKLERLSPAYKVFYDYAKTITIKGKLSHDAKTFDAVEPGAGARLEEYVARAEKNYYLSLKYFLYNPFSSLSAFFSPQVLRHTPQILRLFSQSMHGFVKKSFKNLQLQQILEYPTVFLGASPYNAPALYQLMSYLDFKQGVFYPQKGMYQVVLALQAIGKELGVTYKTRTAVDKIVVKDGQACGVKVAGKTIQADIVISNADLKFTETRLLDRSQQSYNAAYWQKRTAGPSALLLYLGVKGKVPQLDHHNLFFVKNWRKNFEEIYASKTWPEPASIYVCKPSAHDKTVAPEGCENLFVLVPLPAGVSKNSEETAEYAERYLEQLEKMAGIPDLRDRIIVKEMRDPAYFGEAFNAWAFTALGMSHTLRQSAFLRPKVHSKKVSGLYYVGAGTQPGIGVPMCLISSQLVYKKIVGDHSAGPLQADAL